MDVYIKIGEQSIQAGNQVIEAKLNAIELMIQGFQQCDCSCDGTHKPRSGTPIGNGLNENRNDGEGDPRSTSPNEC